MAGLLPTDAQLKQMIITNVLNINKEVRDRAEFIAEKIKDLFFDQLKERPCYPVVVKLMLLTKLDIEAWALLKYHIPWKTYAIDTEKVNDAFLSSAEPERFANDKKMYTGVTITIRDPLL